MIDLAQRSRGGVGGGGARVRRCTARTRSVTIPRSDSSAPTSLRGGAAAGGVRRGSRGRARGVGGPRGGGGGGGGGAEERANVLLVRKRALRAAVELRYTCGL